MSRTPPQALLGHATLLGALTLAACDRDEPGPLASAEASPATERAVTSAPPARPPSGPALDTRLELAVRGKPEGLATLDLDGDGRDELLVVQRSPGRLSCLSKLPEGWRLTHAARELEIGDYALGPALLREGLERPLVVYASRSTLEVGAVDFLTRGAPRQLAGPTLESAPRALVSGRLDDGEGERVVIATAAGELVHWSPLGETRRVQIAEREVSALLLLEDASGVLVADRGARRLALYDTSGERRASRELDGLPRDLLERDLDASGDTELVVAGGDRALWVYGLDDERGPEGWLERAPLVANLDRIPLRLAGADVDGDGRDEVIALYFGQLSYRALSLATASPEVARGYAGQAPWDLATGDFDGDGRADLAFANRDARRVSLVWGAPGSGLREPERVRTGRAPHSVATLPPSAGGAARLVVIHSLEDSLAVYSRGPEGWSASARMPAGPSANHLRTFWNAARGEALLAWTTSDAQGARLRVATAPAEAPGALLEELAVGRGASDLWLGDLDADGRTDALVCDEEAHALRWVRLDPRGEGPRLQELLLPSGPTAAVRWRREPLELLLSCADEAGGSGLARVRLGAEGLELAEFVPVDGLCRDLAAADVDGDGAREAVVLTKASSHESGGRVEVWRPGSPWRRVASAPTGGRPYALAARDWSGDGRAEVVVSAQNSHNLGLWRARLDRAGKLHLERQADLGVGLGPLDLRFVDLDADGALELVVTNAFSDDLSILRRR